MNRVEYICLLQNAKSLLESIKQDEEQTPTFIPGKTCASKPAAGRVSSTGLEVQGQCHCRGNHYSYRREDHLPHWLDGSEVAYLDPVGDRHRRWREAQGEVLQRRRVGILFLTLT
jgi:hypothetical protein